jgi:hypothetical protein
MNMNIGPTDFIESSTVVANIFNHFHSPKEVVEILCHRSTNEDTWDDTLQEFLSDLWGEYDRKMTPTDLFALQGWYHELNNIPWGEQLSPQELMHAQLQGFGRDYIFSKAGFIVGNNGQILGPLELMTLDVDRLSFLERDVWNKRVTEIKEALPRIQALVRGRNQRWRTPLFMFSIV